MSHCPPRDAAETYLPAFEACVRQGGVSSIMCSYNAVRHATHCSPPAVHVGVVAVGSCGIATRSLLFTCHYR